jgi:hypothetical protein
MDKEALREKTVAELKEMARELPDVKGVSAMKKDDLVELLANEAEPGVGKEAGPKAKPAKAQSSRARTSGPPDKAEIKRRIRELKAEKKEALGQQDRAKARRCNREIHQYKRQLRKMAHATGKK